MEGGTDALKTAGEAVEPMELDPIELSTADIEVIKATQGPMAVRSDAYVPGRGEARRAGRARCSRGWPRCRSAAGCGAWPRSSTTAARASRPTAWACGPCRTARSWTPGRRMAAFRGVSHCYQRPTYADWPYSVFTMAHGRSKEECDAVLDAIADSNAGSSSARRCTRAPSSRRSGCSISRTTSSAGKRSTRPERLLPLGPALGRALPAGAARPPGRRELARAGDARDRPRPDLHRARLRRRADRRRRQRLRRLRLLLGPADPRPRASGDPRGGRRGRRPGHVLRRADGGRGGARGGRHGAHAVGRHAADDVVGHRGVDERDPARPRGDRPRQAPEVRRRLPRARRRAAGPGRVRAGHAGHPVLARRPGGRRGGHRGRALERRRGRAARVRRAPAGGGAGGALPGQHGPDPARGGLPRAAARPLHGLRHAAGLRRGHHRLPGRPGRRAGTHGCAARPDGDGQDPRRRPARRGLRRLGRADGAGRARRRRLPGRAR